MRIPLYLPLFSKVSYERKVLNAFRSSLLQYLPLDDPSGSTARDASGNSRAGAYTGVDLASTPGPKAGKAVPYWDGTNDYCRTDSAAPAFNSTEGAMIVWVKAGSAGVWSDGVNRYLAIIRADSSNDVHFNKRTVTNNLAWTVNMGGSARSDIYDLGSAPTVWIMVGVTWSWGGNYSKAIINSTLRSSMGAPGSWSAGPPAASTTGLGMSATTPANVWAGYLAHYMLFNRAITAAEVALLYGWGA